MAHDQLEGDTAEIELGERAPVTGLHRATIDDHDAALGQRSHRRRHVARTEAHPDQTFVPTGVRFGRRLDQLQVEFVAWALEERALRENAEVPALWQHGEPEEGLVEVHPVPRA